MNPCRKAWIIQPCVAQVQIQPALAAKLPAAGRPQDAFYEAASNAGSGFGQEIEKICRCLLVEHSSIPRMLNDGLRIAAEVLEISQTDPVDSGRMTAHPSAPDQPSYVEQQWRVVGQGTSISG